ncbi:MAG TPA: hypothetical protein DCQ16_00310 [Spirochaetaceae bacterium]|nr:hypothetical protein [Spirochaetaceae bacterium]
MKHGGATIKRLAMTLAGVSICSFSVGMFNLAAFGVDPFQCFAQGSHLPFSNSLSYGTYYMMLSFAMLIWIWLWDKHYIGLATFINLFLTGYIVELSYTFLAGIFTEPALPARMLMLGSAVILLSFGSALYYTADLGVSVYDAISLILAKKKVKIFNYTLPFKWIRVASDFVCVSAGAAFGKIPGIGTIITAFFMGPLISFFNRRAAEPFLRGKGK